MRIGFALSSIAFAGAVLVIAPGASSAMSLGTAGTQSTAQHVSDSQVVPVRHGWRHRGHRHNHFRPYRYGGHRHHHHRHFYRPYYPGYYGYYRHHHRRHWGPRFGIYLGF